MNCKKIKSKFPDYLTGEMKKTDMTLIKNHIKECSSCREELEGLNSTWINLGVLPEEEPTENLRNNFYTMLESYKEDSNQKENKLNLVRPLHYLMEKLWPARPVHQLVFSLLVLFFGISIGYFLPSSRQQKVELEQLRNEVYRMRQVISVSLMKKQSPIERLKGINFSSRIENPDNTILRALLDTLNTDSNLNVRLSAVDALYIFSNIPSVKEGLIRSLSIQTSPLVQLALIDLITEIREIRAVKALKELIKNQNLAPEVKERIELSIQQLI